MEQTKKNPHYCNESIYVNLHFGVHSISIIVIVGRLCFFLSLLPLFLWHSMNNRQFRIFKQRETAFPNFIIILIDWIYHGIFWNLSPLFIQIPAQQFALKNWGIFVIFLFFEQIFPHPNTNLVCFFLYPFSHFSCDLCSFDKSASFHQ